MDESDHESIGRPQAELAVASMRWSEIKPDHVTAGAWLWYRPLLAIGALAIGLAIAFGLHKLAARKAANRKLAPAAAG